MPPTKKPAKPSRPRAPRTNTRDRRELSDAFRDLVRQNPRAASAALDILEIVANSDRRRAMLLVEAAATVVSAIRGRS